MPRNTNFCEFIGNVVEKPEFNENVGSGVANFRIGVSNWRSDLEENQTMWVGVAAWGVLGQNAADTLEKGTMVRVRGIMQFDAETGAPELYEVDGEVRSQFKLMANDVSIVLKDYEPKGSETKTKKASKKKPF